MQFHQVGIPRKFLDCLPEQRRGLRVVAGAERSFDSLDPALPGVGVGAIPQTANPLDGVLEAGVVPISGTNRFPLRESLVVLARLFELFRLASNIGDELVQILHIVQLFVQFAFLRALA